MRNFISILKGSSLFLGIKEEDILLAIEYLNGYKKCFNKNEILFSPGDMANHTGLLIDGILDISQITSDGNLTLLKRIVPGEIFGYALSVSSCPHLNIEIKASSNVEVLLLDTRKLLDYSAEKLCSLEIHLLQNLTRIIVEKNMMLNNKIYMLSQNTLRQKLYAYLQQLVSEQGTNKVTLPMTKEKLSGFLAINRSALSREFSTMDKEGIITIDGNSIVIHN